MHTYRARRCHASYTYVVKLVILIVKLVIRMQLVVKLVILIQLVVRLRSASVEPPCASRFRLQGLGVGGWDSGFGFQGSGFRVWGLGFRFQGLWVGVWGLGFRVQGSGFRVQGSGFRVRNSGGGVQGSGSRFRGSGCESNPNKRTRMNTTFKTAVLTVQLPNFVIAAWTDHISGNGTG